MATMAALSELPRKKKLTTYGKATRKRLPFSQLQRGPVPIPEPTRSESPAASVVDVFDVPLSDDEERIPVAETRKRKLGTSKKTSTTTGSPPKKARVQPLKKVTPPPPIITTNEDMEMANTDTMRLPVLGVKKVQNRAIKSPSMLSQSELRMKAVREPSVEPTTKKVQGLARPTQTLVNRMAKTSTFTSIEVEDRIASVTLYTPKKKTSVIQTMSVSTPSPPRVSPSPTPATSSNGRPPSITPKGKKFLQNLIGEADQIRAKKPRRRLIDTLMDQEAESEDSDDSGDAFDSQEPFDSQKSTNYQPNLQIPESQQSFFFQEFSQDLQMQTVTEIRQRAGLRTYKESRRLLTEPAEDFESQLAEDMPLDGLVVGGKRNGRREIPMLKPIESLHDAETDDTVLAIRSVHEVRLAGAKSHFVDGVQHLLDDIGKPQAKPSSSRRSALMDLATKLLEKDYRRQFLGNGLEQGLFRHLGQETDVVAGFLLASLLFIVMSSETTNSLAIAQLRQQGITELFVRLLKVPQSMNKIVRDRKYNMSKVAQTLALEYQAELLQSKLWEEAPQTSISPRIMAMICIKVMVEKGREPRKVSEIISREMTTKLFGILLDYRGGTFSEIFENKDCQLALSVIEFHSPKGLDCDISTWNGSYLPFIYGILLEALSQIHMILHVGAEQRECLQDLVKLVLSVIHKSDKAANMFSRPKFIATTGNAVVAMWGQLSGYLEEDERSAAPEILNVLTLFLMEISGLGSSVLLSFDSFKNTGSDFLPGMVKVFNDREESSSQVSTIDETNESVSLGFLAFLLGYLGQEPVLRDRIASYLSQGRKISYLARYINTTTAMLEVVNGNEDDTVKKLKAIASNLTSPSK